MKETIFHATDNFSSSFNVLDTMRRKNQLCDVQVMIEGKKVAAHKVILASYSNYFNKKFSGDYKTKKLFEINNTELTPNSFELLIDFMYTSHITINDSNAQELLLASSFLQMENVKEKCLTHLKQTIKISNLMATRDLSVLYQIDNLYDSCMSYVLTNYNDIVKSKTFLSFPYEFMMELLKSDDLCAEEEMVFESTMLWLKHDLNGRLKHLLDLLKTVRLCTMSINYLHNNVQKEELIVSNTECVKYLFEVYKAKTNEGKEDHELPSYNTKHRKKTINFPAVTTITDQNLECNKIKSRQLNFSKSKEVIYQSAEKKVSSFNAMNSMRKEQILCDLSIKTGNKTFSVHKIVLASNSEYFTTLFTGSFYESNKKEIIIDSIKPDTLELVIDFIYTSTLKITEHNVLDILEASNYLVIKEIPKQCIKFLIENINIENCLTLRHYACVNEISGLNKLNKSCLSFISDNFTFVANTNDFLLISFEQIVELIQIDDVNAEEVEIFEAVMRWIKYDLDYRSQFVLRLMKFIKMSRIPVPYYVNNISNDDIIKSNCLCLLHETSNELLLRSNKILKSNTETSTYYTNRQKNKRNKLILTVNFSSTKQLDLIWFIAGSGTYSMKTLLIRQSNICDGWYLVLSNGNIFSYQCSNCSGGTSMILDGTSNSWYEIYPLKCVYHCTKYNSNQYYYNSQRLKCNFINLVEMNGSVYVMTDCGNFVCYNINEKEWFTLEGVPGEHFKRNGLIVLDELIYLVNNNSVLQYCNTTNEWLTIHQIGLRGITDTDLTNFASCSLNGFLYIMGGMNPNNKVQNSARRFNVATKEWSCISNMHFERYLAGATVVNGLIYVIGGKGCDSVEVYDPELNKWILSNIKLPFKSNGNTISIGLSPDGGVDPENISDYYNVQKYSRQSLSKL